jgi:hypothetical protein
MTKRTQQQPTATAKSGVAQQREQPLTDNGRATASRTCRTRKR